ncbi:MAG: hypothetical protein QM730_12925 [Anaerolineales bacterium]
MKTSKRLFLLFTIILLVSCANQQTSTPQHITQAESTPTKTQIPQQEENKFEKSNLNYKAAPPNLWTKIDKENFEIYPFNWVADFTYEEDGTLWIVGGFGVIRRKLDGSQTWYSIKNGLPKNFFTRVAISPKGDVWIGGTENALFRLDGENWNDEGVKLPQPFDDRTSYLCYSKAISGIDFSPDGSVWVMNNGIEIYTQVNGQWANFPLPKDILPIAGGGACPVGIRVLANNNITIKLSPCCDSAPTARHFDGKVWNKTEDYAIVDELITSRHSSEINSIHPLIGAIQTQAADFIFTNWPFSRESILPDFLSLHDTQVTTDSNGTVWISDSSNLYNNQNGVFQNFLIDNGNWSNEDADLKNSKVLITGKKAFYYQKDKRPYKLEWLVMQKFGYYNEINSFTIDQKDNIWFYIPRQGLIVSDHGEIQSLGITPDNLPEDNVGGINYFQDGKVWIGTRGGIWQYYNDNWRKIIVSDEYQLFTHFAEDDQGNIYGATNEGVYDFSNDEIKNIRFVNQFKKPYVVSGTGGMGMCTFNKRYIVIGNCPYFGQDVRLYPEYDFKSLYLGVQADGSVIYINNHIIAKLINKNWKSFLFDTFAIDSATVDQEGNIWILSRSDGLFKLKSNIFDIYQELITQ